jgi:hypothetical protein
MVRKWAWLLVVVVTAFKFYYLGGLIKYVDLLLIEFISLLTMTFLNIRAPRL